jgi:hypothetical protein
MLPRIGTVGTDLVLALVGFGVPPPVLTSMHQGVPLFQGLTPSVEIPGYYTKPSVESMLVSGSVKWVAVYMKMYIEINLQVAFLVLPKQAHPPTRYM